MTGTRAIDDGAEQFHGRIVALRRIDREGIAFRVGLEIAAGAERLLAGACDHNGANLRGGFGLRDAGAKAVENGLVERISPLLSIDGEP